jgi:hypothetical protein
LPLRSRASRSLRTSRAFSYWRKAPGNLAHDAGRIGRVGKVVTGRGDDAYASLDQHEHPEFLRDQITGEPARILDKDNLYAIVLDTIQERGKARPRTWATNKFAIEWLAAIGRSERAAPQSEGIPAQSGRAL